MYVSIYLSIQIYNILATHGHSCKKNSDNQNPQHKPEAKQPTKQNDPPNQEHQPPNPTAEITHPQPVTATPQQYPPSKKQNAQEKVQDKSQDLDRPNLPPKHQESQQTPHIKPPKPNSTENQKMDQQQSIQPTTHTQETAQRKGKGREMAETSNEITTESIMESGHSRTLTANAREENEVTSSSRRDSSPSSSKEPLSRSG
ncbi:hypothetical protein OIU77_021166 [Salix suchowensis]|uniref:Uncharacterized protein n=1 Tax=Salix suchowensis TaxID=1278906 RepID=A0ABQ9CCC2_9ROSI|nr:hypothetical protein OIU77_021166 [Salix suchowensis]